MSSTPREGHVALLAARRSSRAQQRFARPRLSAAPRPSHGRCRQHMGSRPKEHDEADRYSRDHTDAKVRPSGDSLPRYDCSLATRRNELTATDARQRQVALAAGCGSIRPARPVSVRSEGHGRTKRRSVREPQESSSGPARPTSHDRCGAHPPPESKHILR